MILRQATSLDAPAIAKVHRISRQEAMPWLPVVHTAEEDLAFFRDVVLPDQNVFVADMSGYLAGFIAYQGDWLNHLYIHPDHARRGIGSDLLAKAQAGSPVLQLWTFQQNLNARAFYARHGFSEVELTDGASNEEKTPDVRMTWQTP